jgi:hypothetical protein
VVFGITKHQFRVFGEYYITPGERDLERFQMGFEFVPETVLWLGRFHQPASAWNTEHHHGQYLQTDITRPYIERWEDEQGVIPQHITGALFESRQSIGKDGAIQISAGVGAAPALTNGSRRHRSHRQQSGPAPSIRNRASRLPAGVCRPEQRRVAVRTR